MKIRYFYISLFILAILVSPLLIASEEQKNNDYDKVESETKVQNTNETAVTNDAGHKIRLSGLYDTGKNASGNDPFSQAKFVPGISFIMDFSYMRMNLDNEEFAALETPGFFLGGGHDHEGHSHAAANSSNGFNFNYGELVLYSSVDPYFDLFTAFHLSENSFEIEEAYVTTRRLPLGLGLKIGKFFSAFGRQNAQHAHQWDFIDIPLVLRAFFGEEGLSEKGLQLNWVAPTDFYLSFGVETLQGSNETSFGTEGFDLIDAGTEEAFEVEETPLPNLWTFYSRTSLELGDLVVLAGASYALGKTRINRFEEETDVYGFSGDTHLLGFDLYVKYIVDSYRYFSIQMEYIWRHVEGTRFDLHQHDSESEPATTSEEHEHEAYEVESSSYEKKQAGFYGQMLFRFHKSWRIGARWDALNKNDILMADSSLGLPDDLNRYSFMMDFTPTEFSRIRLQYSLGQYSYLDDQKKNYNRFVLQFNFAIGAHGAHPF